MEYNLGDITVQYQMVGTGRPLLFLHGSVGDHQLWFQTLEPLFDRREGWKRIYLDLPGHGLTQAPDWLENDDQVLDVLLRFIDQVIPERQLVVGGFSWGGYLAQGILHHRFSEVEGLLLIASEMHRHNEKIPTRNILIEDETLLVGLDEMAKGVSTGLLVVQNSATIARLQALSQSLQSFRQDDADYAARFQWGFSVDIERLPKPFEKPTLFLLGKQDDHQGYRNHWRILENFPRATFAVLDEAGHGVGFVEKIEISQSLIGDWLDRIEEGKT